MWIQPQDHNVIPSQTSYEFINNYIKIRNTVTRWSLSLTPLARILKVECTSHARCHTRIHMMWRYTLHVIGQCRIRSFVLSSNSTAKTVELQSLKKVEMFCPTCPEMSTRITALYLHKQNSKEIPHSFTQKEAETRTSLMESVTWSEACNVTLDF